VLIREKNAMFTELMPLLKQRVLVVTISRVDDELICVSVIPKKRETTTDENAALTVPLSFTGKPDELDRELPAQLTGFTESVIRTGSNLEEIKAQHTAAVKAVDAENRKRLDEKKKVTGKSAPPPEKAAAGPELKDGRPVFGSKASSEAGATGSLFDAVEKQECQVEPAVQSSAGA
jgi:PRTRC genetic system protein E